MNKEQYTRIGEAVVSILFVAFIIWWIFGHYVTKIANITGLYYREIETEVENVTFDMYVSFDASDKDRPVYTYYYVLNDNGVPSTFLKITGHYKAHNLNRVIGTLCYDPIDKKYRFMPMFSTPVHITMYQDNYYFYDIWDRDISPEDFNISMENVDDLISYTEQTLQFADVDFTKVSEMPSEYQFQFSVIEY